MTFEQLTLSLIECELLENGHGKSDVSLQKKTPYVENVTKRKFLK